MRIFQLCTLLICFGFSFLYSEDSHDHNEAVHDHENNHLEAYEHLGFGMVVVQDRMIANRSVTALPLAAVFVENGKTFVLAKDEKDGDKLNRWEVELGNSDGSHIEAMTGVFPGDQVVVKNRSLANLQTAPVAMRPMISQASVARSRLFCVQIGAFSKSDNARKVAKKLESEYGRSDVRLSKSNGKSLYRVSVGEYSSMKNAEQIKNKLVETGFTGAFVVAFK